MKTSDSAWWLAVYAWHHLYNRPELATDLCCLDDFADETYGPGKTPADVVREAFRILKKRDDLPMKFGLSV